MIWFLVFMCCLRFFKKRRQFLHNPRRVRYPSGMKRAVADYAFAQEILCRTPEARDVFFKILDQAYLETKKELLEECLVMLFSRSCEIDEKTPEGGDIKTILKRAEEDLVALKREILSRKIKANRLACEIENLKARIGGADDEKKDS